MAADMLQQILARTLRPDVTAMRAYVVQPSSGMVKLDAMENPFRLPEPLRTELGARLAEVAINRYPGDRIDDLRTALGLHAGLPQGFSLMLGNGSDELISLLGLACAIPGATVLTPVPGFVMYEMSAKLQGLRFVGVPLTSDFELDLPAMLAAMAEHKPALVYIAYPNNPTANLFDDDAIETIVEAATGLVVIDEAYQPFAARSYLDRLSRHHHVILMRTLSKFGLAGARLGYMLGRSALISEIDKVRPPYNVSALNAEAAMFALDHAAEFDNQAAVLRTERQRLSTVLAQLPGFRPYPSEANMVLVRVPDASRIYAALKERRVLIKNVSNQHALLANCLRLTVGTPEENDLMIAALEASLK